MKLVKNFHYHQYYITCAFHNQLSVVEVCLFVSGWVPVQYVREEVRVINYYNYTSHNYYTHLE